MAKKKILYAGVGAVARVLLRYVTPKSPDGDGGTMNVVLVGKESHVINGKEKHWYTFRPENEGDDGPLMSANVRYVHVVKEGDINKFFDPRALEKKLMEAEIFTEPRTKWKKSKAKEMLYTDIVEGRVPLEDDSNMPAAVIYSMHSEYADYDPDKFAARLESLRQSVKGSTTRANEDLIAFETYKSLHKVSLFSHLGYIEYQGSEAQRLLRKDIQEGRHISLGKKELYELRPEYFTEFPLNVFRDKLYQEIRTAKYVHTTRVKGKLHKSS
jgi:hypothetical protein